MMQFFKIGVLSSVMMLSACNAPTPPSFEAAVDAHLAAIVDRDLEAYQNTITKTDALPLIFPDGSFLATRAEVDAMTKDWFSNKDWRMTFEPVSKVIGSDLGVALVKYAYQDTPEGDLRFAYLSLTFQLQDGEWRLVLDQNTRIQITTE